MNAFWALFLTWGGGGWIKSRKQRVFKVSHVWCLSPADADGHKKCDGQTEGQIGNLDVLPVCVCVDMLQQVTEQKKADEKYPGHAALLVIKDLNILEKKNACFFLHWGKIDWFWCRSQMFLFSNWRKKNTEFFCNFSYFACLLRAYSTQWVPYTSLRYGSGFNIPLYSSVNPWLFIHDL